MFARFRLSKSVRLNCESLEDRLTPTTMPPGVPIDHLPPIPMPILPLPSETLAYAAASGGKVGVFNADDTLHSAFTPFEGFNGPVTVANRLYSPGRFVEPLIAATANGHVKTFDARTGAEIGSFFAYSGFDGPISVAVGDINNDGFSDIITGAGVNGHVKAFDARTGAEISSFFAYSGFNGPISVAAGGLNEDGYLNIITGAGINGHVKEFNGRTGDETNSFFAYSGFNGSIAVATGYIGGRDFSPLIITGVGSNGHVKVFNELTGDEIRSFFTFPGSNADPIVANIDNGIQAILVGTVGGPVKLVNGQGTSTLQSFDPHDIFGEGIGT